MGALVGACGSATGGRESDAGATGSSAGTTAAVDPTEGELVALALPMSWMPVAADADPLVEHRPASVTCPLGAWLLEPQGLEISTQTCNYASFGQPSQVEVVPGARIVG